MDNDPSCIARGVPLAPHTTMNVGGPAAYYAAVVADDELRAVLAWAKTNGQPMVVLGGGSNVIFPDAGFSGVVIHPADERLAWQDETLIAGAGIDLEVLIQEALRHDRGGLSSLAGIPGHIGGMTRRNAGSERGWLGEHVLWVETMSRDGELRRWDHDACRFAAHRSVFQSGDEIIIRVAFNLPAVTGREERERIEATKQLRLEHQPIGDPSAGRMFQNVIPPDPCPPNLHSMVGKTSGTIAAWKLVAAVELGGYQLGGMKIHDQHPNFLVNTGSGTADQAVQLMSLVKMRVRDTLGVQLHDDIQLIGFNV